MRISVLIPAWNEAAQLPGLVDSLLAQEGVSMEAVVVANGCTDATASIARSYCAQFAANGHSLAVLELARQSKPAALRAGDLALRGFPRAYVDADAKLSPSALVHVAAALDTDEPRLAAPRIRFATSEKKLRRLVSFLEKASPFADEVVGGGFYAVNRAGRCRWEDFPDLISDDGFVVSAFAGHERILVNSAWFQVRFPSEERLIPVLARWEVGLHELRRQTGRRPPGARPWRVALQVAKNPRTFPVALFWWRLRHEARRIAAHQSRRSATEWSRADG
ncbi:MAG: glycosyltransferase family 2 protein [Phenylobacterium sp.]